MEVVPEEQEDLPPRRNPRRACLKNLTNLNTTVIETLEEATPTSATLDELIIQQRGRRSKPITWSPVDYNKTDILGPPRDRTPERTSLRPEINSKLRRRLIMNTDEDIASNSKQLGHRIAKKLKMMSSVRNKDDEKTVQQ